MLRALSIGALLLALLAPGAADAAAEEDAIPHCEWSGCVHDPAGVLAPEALARIRKSMSILYDGDPADGRHTSEGYEPPPRPAARVAVIVLGAPPSVPLRELGQRLVARWTFNERGLVLLVDPGRKDAALLVGNHWASELSMDEAAAIESALKQGMQQEPGKAVADALDALIPAAKGTAKGRALWVSIALDAVPLAFGALVIVEAIRRGRKEQKGRP